MSIRIFFAIFPPPTALNGDTHEKSLDKYNVKEKNKSIAWKGNGGGEICRAG
jgi:hypothetical protein